MLSKLWKMKWFKLILQLNQMCKNVTSLSFLIIIWRKYFTISILLRFQGSSDSGKGGSDVATPPPSRTPQLTLDPNLPISYEFVIPQNLVGKLIGRQGCFVQSIKDRCNAHVYVRRHPTNNRLKVRYFLCNRCD